MRAYCINLDRRPDRLAHMTAEFARHGLPFERLTAVDAQDPTVAAAASTCGAARLGSRMSVGAYACFQSHRAVWHRITDSGERYGMVFEDDVHLADAIERYLQDAWVPVDADLVRLETAGIRVHLDHSGFPAGVRRLHRLRGYHHGTGCYVIHHTAAARLIDATAEVFDPVDETMFSPASPISRMMRIYQMVPAPVIQGDREAAGASGSWAESSIIDRFADRRTAKTREGVARRVARRLGSEVSGRLRGWTYDLVTHG